jgi:hypothetical protein
MFPTFSSEVHERAVLMVLDRCGEKPWQWVVPSQDTLAVCRRRWAHRASSTNAPQECACMPSSQLFHPSCWCPINTSLLKALDDR